MSSSGAAAVTISAANSDPTLRRGTPNLQSMTRSGEAARVLHELVCLGWGFAQNHPIVTEINRNVGSPHMVGSMA